MACYVQGLDCLSLARSQGEVCDLCSVVLKDLIDIIGKELIWLVKVILKELKCILVDTIGKRARSCVEPIAHC